MEIYQGAPIVYGQGNFLFDMPSMSKTWAQGALVCLELAASLPARINFIPYEQTSGTPGLLRMSAKREDAFMAEFHERSKSVDDPEFVANQWSAFCESQKRGYLHGIRGKPGLLRRVAGKLDLLHYFDSPGVQRQRLNLIRCESHREALSTVLERESDRSRECLHP